MMRNLFGVKAGWVVAVVVAISTDMAAADDGGGIRWQKDLPTAAATSEKLNKPMLIKFHATWCGPCRRMAKVTFADAKVVQHINGCFVPVSVDVDTNEEFVKAAGVTVFPTTVIVSSKMVVLKRITGYKTPDELRKQLGQYCKPASYEVAATPKPTVALTPTPVSVKTIKPPTPPSFGATCLVSMLDDRNILQGVAEYALVFRGQMLVFASAAYKKRFETNPGRYWPKFDGVCTVTAIESRKTTPGDPDFAAIYQKRIWFFASAEQRARFANQPTKYLADVK